MPEAPSWDEVNRQAEDKRAMFTGWIVGHLAECTRCSALVPDNRDGDG